MNNNTNPTLRLRAPRLAAAARLGVASALLVLTSTGGWAATEADSTVAGRTTIANIPLGSARTSVIKPNIMLLVDSSKSMAWTHMPDDMENVGQLKLGVGYRSSACNALYFDPAKTYVTPRDYKGDLLPTPAWPFAAYNYYLPAQRSIGATNADGVYADPLASINLNANFQAYDTQTRQRQTANAADTPQKAYYYVYTGTIPLTATLCKEVEPDNSLVNREGTFTSSINPLATWQRKLVSEQDAALKTRFTLWYQYYRTRMLLIKSGVGQAFNGLSDGYRVGLVTMAPTKTDGGPVDPSQYIPIADFTGGDGNQKKLWYDKLNGLEPTALGSPAREGLARVGLHYADRTKLTGTAEGTSLSTASIVAGMQDPYQGSCQPNFTIMTTDGYWGGSSADEKFGPIGMTGARVGNQDGDLSNPNSPRPMWDGRNSGRRTTVDAQNKYQYYACAGVWVSKLVSQISASTSRTTRSTSQVQAATSQLNERTAQINESTARITRTTNQTLASTTQTKVHTEQRLERTSQTAESTQQWQVSTEQTSQSTSQLFENTSRTTRSTSQPRESTSQTAESTSQTFQSTSQILRTTTYIASGSATLRRTTTQNTQSTAQINRSTSQRTQSTTQQTIRTDQRRIKTSQINISTSQIQQSTAQMQQSTLQNRVSTAQIRQSTSQVTASTSQLQISTSQPRVSTQQITRSTSQLVRSTSQPLATYTQNRKATSQLNQYTQWTDRSTTRTTRSTSQTFRVTTESYTPVASCSPGPGVSCTTETTGPTGVANVAACVAASPTASNEYMTVTCNTVSTGPTRVDPATCVTGDGNSGNNWTKTTCTPGTSAGTPVASCSAVAASGANNWTATTCSTVTTGPDFVASCTPVAAGSGNSYTATTCPAPVVSSAGVQSCTPSSGSAPNWINTTCSTATSGPTGVSACTPVTASASNQWTTTTCETVTTGPTPVASCTAASATGSNSYTATTCGSNVTGPTPTQTCTPITATSGNSWTATTCSTATTGPTGVSSCAAIAPNAGNQWTTTSCATATTGPTGVASCTPASASGTNSWTTTTCNTVTSGPTPVASCTPVAAGSGNSYVATTCNTATTGPTPAATCTPISATSGNSYMATTCSTATTGPDWVQSCTPVAASSSNNYVATLCNNNTSGPTGVSSCTPVTATAGNNWKSTTCNTVTTGPTPIASCSPITAGSGNQWKSTTCNTVVNDFTPTASCSPSSANSGNSFTTTTCDTVTTGPTGVASCTPIAASAGNQWTATTCPIATSGPTGVASCTPSGASGTNSYVATSCNTVTSGPTPVASCSPITAGASNQYTTTTCNTTNAGPTPVASCTPATAGAGNSYTTTTCAVVTTGPTVGACSPSSATAGNQWTTTTCEVVQGNPSNVPACVPEDPGPSNGYVGRYCQTSTVGPIAVASCTPQTASSSNNWVGITCQTSTTGPTAVPSCVASGPTAGNSYVTTTCNTQTTGPTFVQTCTQINPAAGNGYKTTSCNTTTTGPTGVASCTPITATALNNWKTTTCDTATTGPTGVATVGSCTPITASASNSWTTTTCNTVVTGPTPVATCVVSTTGTTTNNWTRRTCNTVTTGPTYVASCTAETANAGNSYKTTTCNTVTTGPTGVQSCSNIAPSDTNGYKETTCENKLTGPTFVQTCAAATGSGTNQWKTTTCNTALTGPDPVATCTPVTPTSGNGWKTVTCADNNSTPVPTASCTAAPASAGNNYVKTVCDTVTTPPTGVQSCTNAVADAGNQYTSTTCSTNNTGPTGVASCTPRTAAASNSWEGISCNTALTGPTPVASCTPAATANLGNNWTTRTCNTVNTGPTPVASCTPVAANAGNNYIAVTCNTATTPATGVQSCTPASPTLSNNYTETTCNTVTTGPTGVASCTASAASGSNTWVATTCDTVTTGPTPVASCTAGTAGDQTITTCNTQLTGPTVMPVADCTPQTAGAGNTYTGITCTPVDGRKAGFTTKFQVTEVKLSGSTVSEIIRGPLETTTAVQYLAETCYAPGATVPQLPDDGRPGDGMAPLPSSVSDTINGAAFTCTEWPCVKSTPSNEGGSSNSLADVAQYFYVTDLRPGTDYGTDFQKGPPAGGTGVEDDKARYQHMTTFVVGLGVSGDVKYQENYREGVAGDFDDIRQGRIKTSTGEAANWPIWPDPAINYEYVTGDANSGPTNYNNPRSIDDFWHAAVNGRGRYFSASDSGTVVSGIKSALGSIGALGGAGAGASTSTLELTDGDSTAFAATYRTEDWVGDLTALKLDPATGESTSTLAWSQSASLSLGSRTTVTCDNRKIYYFNSATPDTKLSPFTWLTDNNGATTCGGTKTTGLTPALQAHFGAAAIGKLSQALDMTTSDPDQRTLAAGPALVNFLRGQRANEGYESGSDTKLFRRRASVLGDIVGSQPQFVKPPSRSYLDEGYEDFKKLEGVKDRKSVVYVGANDGMLHAFDAANGAELWAYIPTTVMPTLYKLADDEYETRHAFFVDGTATVGDVYHAAGTASEAKNNWRTILVGGLGAGGKSDVPEESQTGFYALDVTNPDSPKALWEFNFKADGCYAAGSQEFTDCHLGLTFGRPIITKRAADNKWVVLVTSGYNNVGGTDDGNGKGFLYVLDAMTGRILEKVAAATSNNTIFTGNSGTPSGLRHINNYTVNANTDNKTLRAYSADLLGNVWRFDMASLPTTATLLGTAKDKNGLAQPITTRPEIAEVDGGTVVMVGTGRLLSISDLLVDNDPQVQSVYSFKDGDYTTGGLREQLRPMKLTTQGTGDERTRRVLCDGDATACAGTTGWVLDLTDPGERVNVDMRITSGTLIFASNIPDSSQCSAGGNSLLNYLDLITGRAVGGDPDSPVSVHLSSSLTVGLGLIRTTGGKIRVIATGADGKLVVKDVPIATPPSPGKRVSWREITGKGQ